MSEELAERAAKPEPQGAEAVTRKYKSSLFDERSQELSKLRAQCLRETADAAFAEYSCTVVEQLKAFSPQLLRESGGPEDGLFNGFVRKSRLHRVLMRFIQLVGFCSRYTYHGLLVVQGSISIAYWSSQPSPTIVSCSVVKCSRRGEGSRRRNQKLIINIVASFF